MAAPTIVQIVPQVETGGSEQSALEINEALARAGANSLVVSEGGRLVSAIARAGGVNIHLPVASKNPLTMFRNIGRLRELIRTHNVDLVHARSRAPAWSALFAARAERRPFVTTYHGSYSSPAPFKTTYNSVMARGDVVIANSRFTAQMVHERHGTPFSRMPIIPRGIDPAKFDPRAVEPDRLRVLQGLWQLQPGDLVVLQAARITKWKGQRHVIEAAGKLMRAGALGRAVFILAGAVQGRDKYFAELRSLIGSCGVKDRVRIVGHCDDMAAAYALAHVSVIASDEAETFGRSSIEAQAMGAPVIVTDIGATPETFIAAESGRPDFTGWLVPPADSDRLAEALARALHLSPQERAAIGARARAHVVQNFSLAAMQRQTLQVYDRILGSQLAPAFDASFGGYAPAGAR